MSGSATSRRLNAPCYVLGWACALNWCVLLAATAGAEEGRTKLLGAKPIAECEVQTLSKREEPEYSPPNALLAMNRPEAEDPLDYYLRTQDDEWAIAHQVDRDDPWIRLLLLSPGGPVLVDIAVEIDGRPFRAAREEWIDRLLAEAKATFLIREGVALAESATTAAESAAPTDSAANEKTAETDDDPSMIKARGRQRRTVLKRLINYLAAEQTTAQREEVRWLLAEWTGGPMVLALGPAFSWRRAEIAPLWQCLDRDRDHRLSSAEIDQAISRLEQADVDEDDIVDLRELQRLTEGYAHNSSSAAYPLVTVLDENTNWSALRRHLSTAYGGAGNSNVSADAHLIDRIVAGDSSIRTSELPNLLAFRADIACRVTFGSDGGKVTLLRASAAPEETLRTVSSSENTITVELAGAYMEISAAQGPSVEHGDMRQTQVAVGAVVDGYRLLRLLDADNNRRLSLREQRQLDGCLTALDRNHDRQIDVAESPVAIRLAVTHGPHVHEHLGQPTAAVRKIDDDTAVDAPAWFAGMDRNHDGDLSPREFQGSPTQFAQLDHDGDGLISDREVQESTSEGE